MEAIYKHKQSGAKQILSDTTAEILGKEWEYYSEIENDLDTQNSETPKVDFEVAKSKVSEVNPNDSETPKVEDSIKKTTTQKAVSSKDLE